MIEDRTLKQSEGSIALFQFLLSYCLPMHRLQKNLACLNVTIPNPQVYNGNPKQPFGDQGSVIRTIKMKYSIKVKINSFLPSDWFKTANAAT